MRNTNISLKKRSSILSILLICVVLLLSSCAKAQPEAQESTSMEEDVPSTQTNTNDAPELTDPQSDIVDTPTVGLPEGVTVKRVLNDVMIKNKYRKKVELLSDGGKHVTITDPNGEVVIQKIEYDGVIQSVQGNQVTVKVDQGGQQTITIPNNIVIDDEDNFGLNKGVEIEWEVDTDGQILSVELDD
ncbi:hypothetical protein [Paenibacillus sp. CMAA1364]